MSDRKALIDMLLRRKEIIAELQTIWLKPTIDATTMDRVNELLAELQSDDIKRV